MVKLGDYNDLTVTRMAERPNPHAYGGKETFGVYLDAGHDEEILMPQKYVPEGTKVGDTVHCFVYLDQDERPIATTETPLARVGEFAYLECTWVNEYGAFLDWGVMKNVFCPFREQKRRMEIGNKYIVYLYVDEESYRIVASAKVEHFLTDIGDDLSDRRTVGENNSSDESSKFKVQSSKEADLLVWQKTDLGFKVIINNRWGGLIYENQIYQYVHTGDRLKGYIQQVRPDGKIDATLQPTGRQETESFAETLLQWIKEHDGQCPFGDKSDPEDIKRTFHVSKKTFKRAVGDLYKRRLITIEDDGLRLV